jgi:NAD-dependent dihydropyrimidine dehydrogenase PreA subunit
MAPPSAMGEIPTSIDTALDGCEAPNLVTGGVGEQALKAALAADVQRRRPTMAYIICEPCVGTKDTACVDVCPVDCIHPRKDEAEFETAEMLYIHPDECIDCGACVPACPVEAIFALDEVPEKWTAFIPRNAEYFQK